MSGAENYFISVSKRKKKKKNWLQKSLADEVEMKFSGEFFILFPIIKASGDT